ncbi:MAG TPA: patatin-like phospholipase family protein [Moraxellaceae bacterium]
MDAYAVLSACPLFSSLNPDAVARLAATARPVRLEAGERLFAAGDASDRLYIVATGRLRAVFADGRIAGDIARLEPIGEIGLLTGEGRGAGVHALRDSLLFAFSRPDFHAFAMAEPAALMAITQVIIGRMREPGRETRLRAARKIRTLAVIAATPSVDGAAFARELEAVLEGNTTLVDQARATRENKFDGAASLYNAALHEWLSELEFHHKQVVFDAGGDATWTRTTLRQADRIIVVADVAGPVAAAAVSDALQAADLRSPIELVMLRREGEAAGSTLSWKEDVRAQSHYFVRPGNRADMESLARQLTGFGVGLVLGGGGARGFAHVGLLRALRELRIPVDVCGGASMGAYVAALHASGRDESAITETLKDTFMRRKLLNDYRLPLVSLIAGQKFRRHLQGVFGDLRIEHMRTPFFCVSTNLTHARSEMHSEGLVADWLAASMCIPGLAPPVAWQGSLLCDGAVVNSLPTDVMQELGRGVIVASDVSTEGSICAPHAQGPDPDFLAVYKRLADGSRVSLKDVLFRTTSLGSESGMAARAARADMYLRMPVGDIGTFDWPLLDGIIEKGYEHAMAQLPALLGKLEH